MGHLNKVYRFFYTFQAYADVVIVLSGICREALFQL